MPRVTVSVKTVKKNGKRFYKLLQFDTHIDLSLINTDWMPVMLKINIHV